MLSQAKRLSGAVLLGFVLSSPLLAQSVLVKDIWPGPGDPSIRGLTDVNGTLFFIASDAPHGAELWKSDGTPAGTVLVKDIWPSTSSPFRPVYYLSYSGGLTYLNGSLFFYARKTSANSDSGYEF
jgi:ELWxxDGT repeat protein